MTPIPRSFVEDDLVKPIFGALWVGLFMATFNGMNRGSQLTFYIFLLMLLTFWLVRKRAREESGG